ncbi:acetyl-CoA carboxylase biotin carboxyl carrier protein subunit [Peribacillus sp. NPDC097206]|uniref:acetyl-CoA carboxylase biotin carboxyl carrier protein subunit n=1 Tax=unclassified Peribacillus TaxID=2675266 RepID=UPI0037F90EBC
MKVTAPMSGSVWKITSESGKQVEAGETIVILESMKMEIPITAETGGTVKTISVQEGDFIQEHDVVAIIE